MENQDYILFEDYLSKALAPNEIDAFEARLKSDIDFNHAFKTYKELSSYLEHKFKNEETSNAFQKNLENISKAHFNKDEEVSNTKQDSKPFHIYKYVIAASVLLLFGIFTFNQFSNPTYGDFADYETISLTVRGSNNELLKTAETAFNSKDFANAEKAFKNLLAQDEDNIELKLYSAIANIELSKFDIADNLLKSISEGNTAYKNKATWFFALSKLKQKDYEACLGILKTIPEDADNYNQAQKLWDQLE